MIRVPGSRVLSVQVLANSGELFVGKRDHHRHRSSRKTRVHCQPTSWYPAHLFQIRLSERALPPLQSDRGAALLPDRWLTDSAPPL